MVMATIVQEHILSKNVLQVLSIAEGQKLFKHGTLHHNGIVRMSTSWQRNTIASHAKSITCTQEC